MLLEGVSLARQLESAFKQLDEELSGLESGIIFFYIRNNVIGKYGIKHDPIECKSGVLRGKTTEVMEPKVRLAFRKLAIDSLRYKKGWTHGEIQFEFAVSDKGLNISVQFESNYNMSNYTFE
ncbi:O-methyltransferase [Paenibacillus turpanensis]|uniref:O-methyltransferase n=1 Tax=Paenibacillus turpanensis TaxID=2689078 RepID=UPI001409F336|nr:O-methyltransferase [Paenibacillus turpanensis]